MAPRGNFTERLLLCASVQKLRNFSEYIGTKFPFSVLVVAKFVSWQTDSSCSALALTLHNCISGSQIVL